MSCVGSGKRRFFKRNTLAAVALVCWAMRMAKPSYATGPLEGKGSAGLSRDAGLWGLCRLEKIADVLKGWLCKTLPTGIGSFPYTHVP